MRVLRRHRKKNTTSCGTRISAWWARGAPKVDSVTANQTMMAIEQSMEPRSSHSRAWYTADDIASKTLKASEVGM